MTGLNRLFRQHCPKCKQPLSSKLTILHVTKSCAECEFREEIYPALGIRITYEESSSNPADSDKNKLE